MSSSTWGGLRCGERLTVTSRSGNLYRCVFLARGLLEAGLYVRLEARGSLARLDPHRLQGESLVPLGPAPQVLLPGDELLVQPRTRAGIRGRLIRREAGHVVLDAAGRPMSIATSEIAPGGLRLVFAAPDLRPGDEFIVRSHSGREYRGRATAVSPRRVEAENPNGSHFALDPGRLDLSSVRVLIALTLRTTTSAAA